MTEFSFMGELFLESHFQTVDLTQVQRPWLDDLNGLINEMYEGAIPYRTLYVITSILKSNAD